MWEAALFSGKISTADKNFTRPPVAAVATNFMSVKKWYDQVDKTMTMTMWYDMIWIKAEIRVISWPANFCSGSTSAKTLTSSHSDISETQYSATHYLINLTWSIKQGTGSKKRHVVSCFFSVFNSYLMTPRPQWWYPYPISIFCNFPCAFHHFQSLNICADILCHWWNQQLSIVNCYHRRI